MKKWLIIAGLLIIIGLIAYSYLPVSLVQHYPGTSVNIAEASNVTIEVIAEELDTPWSMDISKSGDIFFTERSGTVRLIQKGKLMDQPLLKLPSASGEAGTLGLVLDPNFESSRYIFIYYTATDSVNRISRFRLAIDKLVEEDILIDNIPAGKIHDGGRLAFGPDGKLYAGTGDTGSENLAQELSSLAGKILRLNPDGTIPVDNPNGNSYIYSLGHRNVQGLSWDQNGNLYASEHGSQGRDEINLIESGSNYGWPIIQGTIQLSSNGRPPVVNYRNPVIDSGADTWAPAGISFFLDQAWPLEWRNTLLFTGLRSQSLWRYNLDSKKLESLLTKDYGRLRDVHVGPDGAIYLLTSNRDGRGDPAPEDDRILKLTPQSRNGQ